MRPIYEPFKRDRLMNQPVSLEHLTLDLFLYDLYRPLGATDGQVQNNRRRFWQRVYGAAPLTDQKLSQLTAQEHTFANYVELLRHNSDPTEDFAEPLDGYYYPVQLGDTLALQIDCSGKRNDPTQDQQPLADRVQCIKGIIDDQSRHIPPSLGQNWLIYGQQTDPSQKEEAIAQTCYAALDLFPGTNWKINLQGDGTWQRARFFELAHPDTEADGENRSHHVVIFVFPNSQSEADFNQASRDLFPHLIPLFHCRNKILVTNELREQIKQSLKRASGQIQQLIYTLNQHLEQSPLNLKKLQKDLAEALSISQQYETQLSYLKEYQTTLETNLSNYGSRLQMMEDVDGKRNFTSDLDVFRKFEAQAKSYQRQFMADYESMSLGLKPLDTYVKTITNIIELERTQNERNLNQIVAIGGVGLSVASVAVSTFADQAKDIIAIRYPVLSGKPIPFENSAYSALLGFSVSIAIGLLFALLTYVVIRLWPRR